MARPTLTTPVETTVTILRSTADWATTYAGQLEQVFGDTFDGESTADELADGLEEGEQHYVQEQREDVGLTNRREDIVARTQKLVTSGVALATISFSDAANLDDVLSDFSAGPPSHIRSPHTARKALTRLSAALDIHKEPMSDKLANLAGFEQQVSDTIAAIEDLDAAGSTETAETKTARRRRDEARQDAVTFIRNIQLAAEAVEFMQPDALSDLHAIFETHMPRRRPTVHEEDLLEDAAADPQAPATDADAPTPAGSDVDADASVDDDAREPTEA